MTSPSPTNRERLYDACRGAMEFPTCNLCGLPVTPGQAWDESHVGAPKSLGGTTVGIAHRKCNRWHGAKIITPMVAKTKRMRRRHIGIAKPRTITAWRLFNGDAVFAGRER